MKKTYLNAYMEGSTISMVYLREGRLMRTQVTPEHVSYHRAKDFPPRFRAELSSSRSVRGYREEGKWIRVSWADSYARRAACATAGPLASADIASFEADVSPVRRYVVDHGVEIARPRRAYFDIETDSRISFSEKEKMRILCWSLVYPDGAHHMSMLEEDSDAAERHLLEELWECLEDVDQLVAWYGDGFDFVVLEARSTLLKPKGFRHHARMLYLDHLALFKRMNLNSAESGDEKQSMKLQDVSMALLGEGKDDFDASKTWQTWAGGGEGRARLMRYNLQDTDLLRRIEEKTGYVELFLTLCQACRVFPDSASLRPMAQVDTFMLRLGLENGVHFPTRWREDDEESHFEKFLGAYVMEPKKGLLRNVHVADFASMYPNIIRTWNISPETKRYVEAGAKPSEGLCICPSTGVGFSTELEGMLPMAIRTLLDLRKEWSDKQASLPPGTPEAKEAGRRSMAYKVAANSFYGVVGSPFSRYYDKDCSESITQQGAWLIHRTIEKGAERGMVTVYADTDSCFVVGCTEEEFSSFVKELNSAFYPEIVARTGTKNLNKIAYEKQFDVLVFTGKKRYAGLFAHYKGTRATHESKPEVKGLEYKRGDTLAAARRLQLTFVNILLGRHGSPDGMIAAVEPCADPQVFEALLQKQLDSVLNDALSVGEVKVSKSLGKALSEYEVRIKNDGTPHAQPAHLQVAAILLERGEIASVKKYRSEKVEGQDRPKRVAFEDAPAGTRVEFVVTDAASTPTKVIPAGDYAGEFDRYYLWESLVWPPLERLLEAAMPDHDWTRWQKVRPKKVRGREKNPAQLSLGLETAATRVAAERKKQ